MRVKRWMCAAMLAGALACPNDLSAQKITADPNASGAQTQFADEETDKRMAQKVTLQVKRTAVSAILEELSKQTGVTLKAGLNQNDWQVRDRKMNIFCKDLPLSNLMNSISRVMKFKWSKEKSKDGQWVYRLYMDRKSLLDAEAMKAREEERLAKRAAERRTKTLESYSALAGLSEAEVAELKGKSPFSYMMASTGLAKPMSGLFRDSQAAFQALSLGQSANVAGASLSPQGQSCLLETWRMLHKLMSSVEHNSRPLPDDAAQMLDRLTIKINPNADMMGNAPAAFLGEMQIWLDGQRQMEFPLIDPDSSLGKLFGELILTAMETGKPGHELEKELGDRVGAAFAADMKMDALPEPEAQRPDDPALHAKVKIKPDSGKLADVQSALAEAAGTAVVSDSFRQEFPAAFPKDTEMELGDLLDKLGDGFRYDWDKPSSVIEFRDKKWFVKRAAQIPEAWLDEWRKKLKETGTLEFDDVAQICSLTHEQFAENVNEDKVLMASNAASGYYGARDVMKLYNSLNASQRLAVFTPSGLDLGSLSPEQWGKAAKAVSLAKPGGQQDLEMSPRLTGEWIQAEHTAHWTMSMSAGDDRQPMSWRIPAPKYVMPDDSKRPDQVKAEENKTEPKQ